MYDEKGKYLCLIFCESQEVQLKLQISTLKSKKTIPQEKKKIQNHE